VQAAVGIDVGKGPLYRCVAQGVGLTGPMRATEPGPAFIALVAPILEAVSPLPYARLDTDRKPEADSGEAEDASISTRPRK
jgi:hypothetical protein